MKNLSISRKLILGFGIVLGLMVLTSLLSLYSIKKIDTQVTYYSTYTTPNISQTGSMRYHLMSVEKYILQAFDANDQQTRQKNLDQANKDRDVIKSTLEEYANTQRNHDRDAKIEKFRTLLEEGAPIRQEMEELLLTMSEEDEQKARDLYYNEYLPIYDQEGEIMAELTDSSTARSEQQSKEAQAATVMAWIVLLLSTVISIILTVVIVISIRKSIMTPVTEIVNAYRKISQGELGTEITYESKDELGQMVELIRKSNQMQQIILADIIKNFSSIADGDLQIKVELDYPGDFAAVKEAIVHTATSMNYVMRTIDVAAQQVNIGAEQVSAGAQELAAGSTEQASSVEALSTAAVKISAQAEENAGIVEAASQFVQQAGGSVNNGNQHMAQLTEAMSEISASSNQISNITKVIEDIAFQTNILALNAAVEAARAGEAGKGFAVVADEVRNLAAKSAEAAKQTGELIRGSVDTVSRGAEITVKTAQILKDVGENTLKIEESFSKIAQASAEQTFAIEQIKQGLNQVSAVVQTNAATAEENSATSEEMSAQSVTLREEVGKFRLDKGME